jgi:hypothetical protein
MAKAKRAVRVKESAAKAEGIAKAKRTAPALAVHIGSTPATRFRGNPNIFGQLVLDHDRHRALIAMIQETHGDSDTRKKLFEEFTREVKAHAAAVEQASVVIRVLRVPKIVLGVRRRRSGI